MVDLGTLGGDTNALAVNDSGRAVGYSYTAADAAYHDFSWTATGGMVDLGTLGGSRSTAVAVNSGGEVVGYSYTEADAAYHAVLWQLPSV
jgi:probable HAF family extracellular repeat protein